MFNLLSNCQTVFHSRCFILHSHEQCMRIPVSAHSQGTDQFSAAPGIGSWCLLRRTCRHRQFLCAGALAGGRERCRRQGTQPLGAGLYCARAPEAEAFPAFPAADSRACLVRSGALENLRQSQPCRLRVAAGRPCRLYAVPTKVAFATTATGCCGAR